MVVLDDRKTPSSTFLKESSLFGLNMAYYLHCNACYFRPGMGVQRRMFITNCSHIYCETCVTAATKDKCKVCKSQCSTLCLSGKIPKSVESMFMDPVETLQKFIVEFYKKLEFQKSHQNRLMRHMTQQLKEVDNIVKQAQKLEREYLIMKSQNEYLMRFMPKNCHPRGGSRHGASPVALNASPSQSTAYMGKSPNHASLQHRSGGDASTQFQGRRLSIRTPPSGGRLGTVGGTAYNTTTPERGYQLSDMGSTTPLTIPRPIHFNK